MIIALVLIVSLFPWFPGPNPVGNLTAASTNPDAVEEDTGPPEADLVIWSINGSRDGIALALNALRNSEYRTIEVWQGEAPTDPHNDPTDLYSVVRDLVAEKRQPEMYGFTLRISNPTPLRVSNPKTEDVTPSPTIRFEFAKPNSLQSAWKPLYDSVAMGKPLDSLNWLRYRESPLVRFGRLLGTRIVSDSQLPMPDWLKNLDWMKRLDEDLKNRSRSPVVFLGPSSSDEVPALWFLLHILHAQCARGNDLAADD